MRKLSDLNAAELKFVDAQTRSWLVLLADAALRDTDDNVLDINTPALYAEYAESKKWVRVIDNTHCKILSSGFAVATSRAKK